MKLTAEDYRNHYRELSDDEFLTIDRDELVEVARRCYDAELARRQLAPPEQEPEREEGPPRLAAQLAPGNKLVTVAMFLSTEEANIARSVLESADVSCVLTYARESQRLMVDEAVEISLHGDRVDVRNISGNGARDAGSECSAPMPDRATSSSRSESPRDHTAMRLR